MKTDKLQEAAELCADRIDDGIRTARQCAILAYKQGAMAKTNQGAYVETSEKPSSIWHGMDELPAKSAPLFLLTGTKRKIKRFTHTNTEKYEKFCKSNNITRWAYKNEIINL